MARFKDIVADDVSTIEEGETLPNKTETACLAKSFMSFEFADVLPFVDGGFSSDFTTASITPGAFGKPVAALLRYKGCTLILFYNVARINCRKKVF
jgi:hypothetical protein